MSGFTNVFLLIITVHTIIHLTHCTTQLSICDTSCCKALPSCDRPTSLECNCPKLTEVSLGKDFIPKTVNSIVIAKVSHVSIEENALFDSIDLVNFTLRNLVSLEIMPDALKLNNKLQLSSLSFENIGNFTIYGNALSGSWKHSVHINIKGISEANFQKNALSFRTQSLGPTLILDDVEALRLSSEALRARISELSVKNTAMDICDSGSFGRNIHHVYLDHVKIDEVMTESFTVSGKLSLLSSRLKKIHSQAFHGKMSEVIIKGSDIGTVDTNAFLMPSSTELKIIGTRFEELRSNGFFISGNSSLRMEDVNIKCLRRHALIGIKIRKGNNVNPQQVIIRNLSIQEAENASLALGACVNLQMSDLHVNRPWPVICPTEKWIRLLLGIGPRVPLSPPENVVYHQLRRDRRCREDGWRPFPKTDSGSACTSDEVAKINPEVTSKDPIIQSTANGRFADFTVKSRFTVTSEKPSVILESQGKAFSTKGINNNQRLTTTFSPKKPIVSSGSHNNGKRTEIQAVHTSLKPDLAGGLDQKHMDHLAQGEATTDTVDAIPEATDFTRQSGGTDDAEADSDVATRETPSEPEADEVDHSHSLLLYCVIGVLLALSALMAVAVVLLTRRSKSSSKPPDEDVYLRAIKAYIGEKEDQRFPIQTTAKPDVLMTGPSRDHRCSKHTSTAPLLRELERLRQQSEITESTEAEDHEYEDIRYDLCTSPPHRPAYHVPKISGNGDIMMENNIYTS